jgi:hypothetical protein
MAGEFFSYLVKADGYLVVFRMLAMEVPFG